MSGAPIGVFDSAGDGHTVMQAILDQLLSDSTGRPVGTTRRGPGRPRPLAGPQWSAGGSVVETRRCAGAEPCDIRPTEAVFLAAVAATGGARAHASSTRAAARRVAVTRRAFMDQAERGETKRGETKRGETNSRQPPVPTRT